MKSGEALYKQIYQKLMIDIKNGQYNNGKQLPTEIELARHYQVSRVTSQKAFGKLVEDGIVVRIPGHGSFLKSDCPTPVIGQSKESVKKIIALVMGGYGSSFGLDISTSAMDAAEELGMHLIMKHTWNDQKRETTILQSLMASNVSGIILQPAHGDLYNKAIINAVYSKYPIVMVDRFMTGIDVPFVGVDNVKLGKQAVSKLINIGHRNIALLALEDDHASSLKERMQGFLEAFAESRLAVKKDLWLTRINDQAKTMGLNYTDPKAHEMYVDAIAKHLTSHPEITAIFSTEYSITMAAVDAAGRIGKRVPDDISIVSFDFVSCCFGTNWLSHVKQPQSSIGSCAVSIMNDILQGKTLAKRCFLMEGEWIEGNTIAPPSKK